jgi:site-specific DNA-methyltransferase (adenine-specific)
VSKGIDWQLGATRDKVRHNNPRNPKATGGGRDGMVGATRPWIEAAMVNGYHELDSHMPATDAAREWEGWGTALKPAVEPIIMARKPLAEKTVAANVLKWGTGALNIDGCRIATNGEDRSARYNNQPPKGEGANIKFGNREQVWNAPEGRWPANLIHDGSDEVTQAFPETASGQPLNRMHIDPGRNVASGASKGGEYFHTGFGDSGSAARFFYTAKADSDDRLGSKHPTVKPLDLMQYLVRLVTPRGGTVLDPFAGTGSTGEAAVREGARAVLIERETEYQTDIARRMAFVLAGPDARLHESIKARGRVETPGPLFDHNP